MWKQENERQFIWFGLMTYAYGGKPLRTTSLLLSIRCYNDLLMKFYSRLNLRLTRDTRLASNKSRIKIYLLAHQVGLDLGLLMIGPWYLWVYNISLQTQVGNLKTTWVWRKSKTLKEIMTKLDQMSWMCTKWSADDRLEWRPDACDD